MAINSLAKSRLTGAQAAAVVASTRLGGWLAAGGRFGIRMPHPQNWGGGAAKLALQGGRAGRALRRARTAGGRQGPPARSVSPLWRRGSLLRESRRQCWPSLPSPCRAVSFSSTCTSEGPACSSQSRRPAGAGLGLQIMNCVRPLYERGGCSWLCERCANGQRNEGGDLQSVMKIVPDSAVVSSGSAIGVPPWSR